MKKGLCPVCRIFRTILMQVEYGEPAVHVPAPAYQYSHPGEPEYISPRCERCYDKATKKGGKL